MVSTSMLLGKLVEARAYRHGRGPDNPRELSVHLHSRVSRGSDLMLTPIAES